ncbi:MAG: hypothetical protein GY722_22900, partial [bacterium]|nr:hypothetical protein [bacterium]
MKKLSIVCTLAVLLAIGIAYTAAQSMSDFPPGGSSSVPTPSTSYQQALPWSCQSNADCPSINSYCRKRVGYCAAGGSCRVRPSFCPEVYNPVCGCNGVTYTNSCFAAAAGVSVRNVGACGQPQCCDPYEEPGQFGNPICIEGHTCCADGDWRCNDGSGQPTCNSNSVGVGAGEDAATSQSQAFPATLVASDPGNVCDQCCDAADEPGINGNPICFEGATCCAGGKWQCNNGAGHSTCDVDGIACL